MGYRPGANYNKLVRPVSCWIKPPLPKNGDSSNLSWKLNSARRSVVRVDDVLVVLNGVWWGIPNLKWRTIGKMDFQDAIFAKFGLWVAVTILRLSVQTEFRISSARGRWRCRKFENQPTLTPRISEPEVDRSRKIALGKLGCAQLKFFSSRSRDHSSLRPQKNFARKSTFSSGFGAPIERVL